MDLEVMLTTLLPKACAWAEEQERSILEVGAPLRDSELADARSVGVQNPEHVRVLRVRQIPGPEDPELLAAASIAGLQFTYTAGMALRYGIYLTTGLHNERSTLVHELTHTSQYERLGGFQPFLRQYLSECLTVGYDQSSLEREAVDNARLIVP